jgi:hypothetical protein
MRLLVYEKNPYEGEIDGEGEAVSGLKLLGLMAITAGGVGFAMEPLVQATLMDNPAGPMPVLRIATGVIASTIAFISLERIEKLPTAQQLEEYYRPQLPFGEQPQA